MRLAHASRLIARIPPSAAGMGASCIAPLLDLCARDRVGAWRSNLRAASIHIPAGGFAHRTATFHHLLMVYETLALLGGRRFEIQASGVERLDAALSSGRGVLLVSAHVGNWHLGAHFVAARGGRAVHSVAGIQIARGLTAPIRLAMRSAGIRVHPRNGATARFARTLRRGGIVGIQLDGDQHASRGPATRGIDLLARRTGAVILPAVCLREGPGRFRVDFRAVPVREADPCRSEALERILLEMVRESPEQWALFRPLWGSA
jgi:lauroyl/myristoyl acyltransferase